MGCRVLPDKEICELSCEEERINVLLKISYKFENST